MARVAWLLLGLLCLPSGMRGQAQMVEVPELGLRVAPGFRVTLYADHELAADSYAMTLDAHGRVVVTSQGYIRILHDRDGDGRADVGTSFAHTTTGGMGLCFDGNDLYFAGDGALLRFRDADGNGEADAAPERLVPLHFAEHGGHAMRKGPDGWWYLIGGNDTGFTAAQHISLPHSAVIAPEAGAVLRLNPDASQSEIFAHGFRNPYDFDFHWLGDLFTYDSDVEGDMFLPWYTPTRVYHIAHAGHHNWRLTGWRRSWNRADYYLDTTDILAPVGRGSPTGVAVYRHYQFPPYFRNGLFAADWAFGKIFFFALEPEGATFRSRPELFLEPIGTHGFAPNDLAVGMDGALFISVGGRKTRGGVYRIEAITGAESFPANQFGIRMPAVSNELEGILRIPQPLEAWSRAIWLPIAVRLGPGPLTQAAVNRTLDAPLRVRAIEILTEGFKGLSPLAARALAADPAPAVRARAAWSLGRYPPESFGPLLVALAQDPQAYVRRSALEAMLDRVRQLSATNLIAAATRNFGHRDKRVRQIAARLATELPDGAWTAWLTNATNLAPQARLTVALAREWRRGPAQPIGERVNPALSVLSASSDADLRLQALRLIMLALGDFNLERPSVEVQTAYEPAAAHEIQPAIRAAIATAVRPLLPAGDWRVDAEAARLLAMIKDADTNSARKMVAYLTPAATATSDFHYLTVLSRLPAKLPPEDVSKIAAAVLNLDVKLAGQQERPKQNWSLRLEELLTRLMQLHPDMPGMLLTHPQFARPNHLGLVAALGRNHRPRAAALFLAAARNPQFPWSGAAIELLSTLPRDQVIPLFRQQWENFALRDALTLRLAAQPDPVDRPRFLTALDSIQTNVLGAALAALHQLPRDTHPANWLPVLRLLQRLFSEPDTKPLRAQAVALLVRDSGQPFAISETGTDPPALARAYEPVFGWFRLKYPPLAAQLDADANDVEAWRQTLRATPFHQGNAGRGEIVFRERGCLTCHAGASPLGPDLAGVADRFSLEDVFNAIVFPNRDVAPLYRTSRFRLKDGQVFTGIVTFESADGVILQSSATTTVRLATEDIVERQPATLSLMPNGLLAGLAPRDIADLYAYLKALSPPRR